MYGSEESPQPRGEVSEQQVPEEAPEQPSVWTPEGVAEPTEAPAESSTNDNDEGAATAGGAAAAAGSQDAKGAGQGGGQSELRHKNGSDHHDHVSYFVGGLHPEITRAELQEYLAAYVPVEEIDIKIDASTEILYQHFEQFGSIEKANVIRDATGKSRGFGFVQFTSIDSVAVAVEASPHQLDPDNRVDAQPAQDRATRRPLLPGGGYTSSPYYDQSCYYGYGYGGAAAAGPYGYHQSAAAAAAPYPPVYGASPYGAYGSAYPGGGYYSGAYGDAYGLAEGGAEGYNAVRRGDEASSGYPSRSVRGAPY